mmetsp:Transcript_15490/g.33643  ORF Transcript_15490/g.33643 Transcript_15490/m.33643 type:complete len:105 (-) Transcript_15490:108-422(-)
MVLILDEITHISLDNSSVGLRLRVFTSPVTLTLPILSNVQTRESIVQLLLHLSPSFPLYPVQPTKVFATGGHFQPHVANRPVICKFDAFGNHSVGKQDGTSSMK